MESGKLKTTTMVIIGSLALWILWPFYSVPTGSRGVITQFGKIIDIEPEGLTVCPLGANYPISVCAQKLPT